MLSTENMIVLGIALVPSIGHIFVANFRINRNEKSLEDVWRWKDSHVKEAGDIREKYQNQLSELRGAQRVTDEKFNQILAALTEIKDRLTDLENQRSHN